MSKKTSRRRFLRGVLGGTALALALPPLEFDGERRAFADSWSTPFFGTFFWANGLPWHAAHGAEQARGSDLWTPAQEGAFSATPLLQPLMRHRVSVATGLEPVTDIPSTPGGQGDGHMRGFMNALTGDRPRPEGFHHPSHTLTVLRPTIDVFVANHPNFYQHTPTYRLIVAGASTARFHDYGHWNTVSFNGPDAPNQPILQTSALFSRLFNAIPEGEPPEDLNREAMLDAVLQDGQDLRRVVGRADQHRIDAHLDHIRTLASQLDTEVTMCEVPGSPGSVADSLGRGNLIDKARVMGALLARAVSCGVTRTFSFMLTSPATTHVFSNVGVPNGLHKTVHDGHWDQTRSAMLHQMEAFGAFLDGFAVDDGAGGQLLDHGLIYGCSEYGEGYKHSVQEMPVVFAGGAKGRLRRGIHTRIPGGNITRTHLTICQALRLPETQFGDNGSLTRDVIPGFLV